MLNFSHGCGFFLIIASALLSASATSRNLTQRSSNLQKDARDGSIDLSNSTANPIVAPHSIARKTQPLPSAPDHQNSFDYLQFLLKQQEQVKRQIENANIANKESQNENLRHHRLEQPVQFHNPLNVTEVPSQYQVESDRTSSTQVYLDDFTSSPQSHYSPRDESWNPQPQYNLGDFTYFSPQASTFTPPPPTTPPSFESHNTEYPEYFPPPPPSRHFEEFQNPNTPHPPSISYGLPPPLPLTPHHHHHQEESDHSLINSPPPPPPPIKHSTPNALYFDPELEDQNAIIESSYEREPYQITHGHYKGNLPTTQSHSSLGGEGGGFNLMRGTAFEKALKLLIPSALFFTGVSALFPKRIVIPNDSDSNNLGRNFGLADNNGNYRQKRSVSFDDHSHHQYGEVDQSGFLRRDYAPNSFDFPPPPNLLPPRRRIRPTSSDQRQSRRRSKKQAKEYYEDTRMPFNFDTFRSFAPESGQMLESSTSYTPNQGAAEFIMGNMDLPKFDPLPIQDQNPAQNTRKIKKVKRRRKSQNSISGGEKVTKEDRGNATRNYDLSPDGPIIGLMKNYAAVEVDKDSPACQKKALCELALRGKESTGTKFEKFLWNLATLVPDYISGMYDLADIFVSIRKNSCSNFDCPNPHLDIQIKE